MTSTPSPDGSPPAGLAAAGAVLAQRLAQARRRARRSQAEAAAAAAIPRTAISDIERGCRAVGALELAALARCYDVELHDLLRVDDVDELPADPLPQLLTCWPRLARGDQHAVLRYARTLTGDPAPAD